MRLAQWAKAGWPGRLIATATRWVIISWSAFNLFVFVCLIDIMGLGSALVGLGLHWLVGMTRSGWRRRPLV